MNLSFKIVESIDKQTSDNQNNKRVKKTTKFTNKLILAAIVHKNVHLVLRTQIFFFRIKLFFRYFS